MCTARTCIFQFSRDSGMQKHDSLGQETICLTVISLCSVRVFTARLHAWEKSNRQDFRNQFPTKAPRVSAAPARRDAHRRRNHWPVLPPFRCLIGWKQIIKREKKRTKLQCCICSIWLWSKQSTAACWPPQMVAPSHSALMHLVNQRSRCSVLNIQESWLHSSKCGLEMRLLERVSALSVDEENRHHQFEAF